MRMLVRFSACMLVSLVSAISSIHADASDSLNNWEEFRQIIPGHFQDWITAGEDSTFTLIYAEPPPAHLISQYEGVLKEALRGYVGHSVQSRPLGYNGEVSDLVIELDYSGWGDAANTAFTRDLGALSLAIYGTTHGCRALRLSELRKSPPSEHAPAPISVSAIQLDTWLFGDDERLQFSAPESKHSGDLGLLMKSNVTGRFISSDNSLVVLLLRTDAELDFQSIAQVRQFVVDSDYILGGMIDKKEKRVALIGRSRQLSLIDFPALRVEDVFNAITAQDQEWAQSYDRNTPGAGKTILPEEDLGDWAPSYLSAELLDTEFGSLLNKADAVLKSQSLSNSIRYKGYPMRKFENPPYEKGVFDELNQRIGLSSLIFNFNTVGVGHWLIGSDGNTTKMVFALNSTGSFSVTYSPDTKGENAREKEARFIEEAEERYTTWFSDQRSPELVRTVQYMAIYQLFGEAELRGKRLYSDRTELFSRIGNELKTSVEVGISECFDEIEKSEEEILREVEVMRKLYTLFSGWRKPLPDLPESLDELKKAISNAATSIRYDGNLFGDRYEWLVNRHNTLVTEHNRVIDKYGDTFDKLAKLGEAFDNKYGKYETGRVPIWENDEKVGEKVQYKVPDFLSARFNRDKAEINRHRVLIEPVEAHLVKLVKGLKVTSKGLEELEKSFGSNEILFEALRMYFARVAGPGASSPFQDRIFAQFSTRTEHSKLRAQSASAISTPSIVVSQPNQDEPLGEKADEMVGGHNVARQKFKVLVDQGLGRGKHKLANGVLKISPGEAGKIGQLSHKMARIENADPATRQRVFDEVIEAARTPQAGRAEILRVASSEKVSVTLQSSRSSNSTNSLSDNEIALGRDAASNRLYFERPTSDGTKRTTVFGSNLSPELIENAGSARKAGEVLNVNLDRSLTARDVDAIIANYKNARGSVLAAAESSSSGSGGGWGVPPRKPPGGDDSVSPGSWGSSTTNRGPRLVVFKELKTNSKRAVLETDRGRIELLVGENVETHEALAKLSKKIEQGAELTLRSTTAHESKGGTKFLITAFEVKQQTAVSGQLVAKSKTGDGVLHRTVNKFRSLFNSSFNLIRDDPVLRNSPADFIIEVKRKAESEVPGWEVEGKIVIDEAGMRFVFRCVPREHCDEELVSSNG